VGSNTIPSDADRAYTCYNHHARAAPRLPTTTVTDAAGTSTLSPAPQLL
jgi:hypothetical protein